MTPFFRKRRATLAEDPEQWRAIDSNVHMPCGRAPPRQSPPLASSISKIWHRFYPWTVDVALAGAPPNMSWIWRRGPVDTVHSGGGHPRFSDLLALNPLDKTLLDTISSPLDASLPSVAWCCCFKVQHRQGWKPSTPLRSCSRMVSERPRATSMDLATARAWADPPRAHDYPLADAERVQYSIDASTQWQVMPRGPGARGGQSHGQPRAGTRCINICNASRLPGGCNPKRTGQSLTGNDTRARPPRRIRFCFWTGTSAYNALYRTNAPFVR